MMIFKFIYYLILGSLCIYWYKQMKKSSENKDLYEQIQYEIYLIIDIIILTSI